MNPATTRRPLSSFANIHAHDAPPSDDTVLSVRPGETLDPQGFYSIGIHPWDTPTPEEALRVLEHSASENETVVAIGECGLDALRGAPLDQQEEVFVAQVRIAEKLGLPLIIHCVRALDRLLRLRKLHPGGQWVLHGFRGKPSTARQLLAAGIDLSFGPIRNPEAFAATPPGHRFLETD